MIRGWSSQRVHQAGSSPGGPGRGWLHPEQKGGCSLARPLWQDGHKGVPQRSHPTQREGKTSSSALPARRPSSPVAVSALLRVRIRSQYTGTADAATAMVQAVFLDFYNTLAHFEPPRERIQREVGARFGLRLDEGALRRAYAAADDFWSSQNIVQPASRRSPEQQQEFFARYQQLILAEAGAPVTPELAGRIFEEVRGYPSHWVLFDDVPPALAALRRRGLTLGLVSNVQRDLAAMLEQLGVLASLDFVVTSAEAGLEKPHPPIFRLALQRAGVVAAQALHVGDQYHSDVLGARGVGIPALLLDREGVYGQYADVVRIRRLTEIEEHLDGAR
ncbi:MAG: HAD family hydrolase [Dehalococcoidia bacterium]|nr:HAD family hydrolase [Dehalococcoidia bacterium]